MDSSEKAVGPLSGSGRHTFLFARDKFWIIVLVCLYANTSLEKKKEPRILLQLGLEGKSKETSPPPQWLILPSFSRS